MRLQIAAANWKMNKTHSEGVRLFEDILSRLSTLPHSRNTRVVIAPPFIHLHELNSAHQRMIKNPRFAPLEVFLAAQNCSHEKQGAFTGEISAEMVKSAGAHYVIIGHSERRTHFHEDNSMLSKKTDRVLENCLHCIFCCGETLAERKEDNHFKVVQSQLIEGLFHLSNDLFKNVVIAYEPVWAIGTGINASTVQAQEMHSFIRKIIKEKYGSGISDDTTILYGGSCNTKNAKELFSCPDIDGGLIGGASLNADDFVEIVRWLDG